MTWRAIGILSSHGPAKDNFLVSRTSIGDLTAVLYRKREAHRRPQRYTVAAAQGLGRVYLVQFPAIQRSWRTYDCCGNGLRETVVMVSDLVQSLGVRQKVQLGTKAQLSGLKLVLIIQGSCE